MGELVEPFIGSEAVINGRIRKHELRSRYRTVFPDVYMSKGVAPSLQERAKSAWLWSHREGVIAGLTASALHGAKWVDGDLPVELVWANARPPQGIVTRRDRLMAAEHGLLDGLPVTTPDRTAFDLGRLIDGDAAVVHLDALGNATKFKRADVLTVMERHRGSPGLPRLRTALELSDAGAQSPRETWLRLLLVRAGFPKPQTQIPIYDDVGEPRYYLDMGWDDVMIAVEYDGELHRMPSRLGRDIIRSEFISYRGWTHIRVVAGNRPTDIVNRVRRAWPAGVRTDRESA